MKKVILIIGGALFLMSLNACKGKEECHGCHYEKMVNGAETEVELGQKCGSELEELEQDGFTDSDGTKYEVHCHEH